MGSSERVNAEKAIGAETSVALLGVIAGDLIGQGSQRTLPKPRRIMATLLFYSLLSLATAFGAGAARFAAAAGGVVAIASLVLGTTGRVLVDVIDRATGLLTTPGAASSGGPSSGAAPGFGSPSNPNPAGSPGNAPPGYHYVQGPSGWSLVPNDPNNGGAVTQASGRVRSPQPVGGTV